VKCPPTVLDIDLHQDHQRRPSVTVAAASFGCAFADFDGDGFVDLYVGNRGSPRICLYRNNGDSTFTEVRTGVWASNREPATSAQKADLPQSRRVATSRYDILSFQG